jgi:hypothetical protein
MAEVFDLGTTAVVGPDDSDDVEATGLLKQAMALEEVKRSERQSPLFLDRDGFGRLTTTSRFDFDEDQDVDVARDQVDLSVAGTIAA